MTEKPASTLIPLVPLGDPDAALVCDGDVCAVPPLSAAAPASAPSALTSSGS
jgi:hypothetical protein